MLFAAMLMFRRHAALLRRFAAAAVAEFSRRC